MHKEPCERGIGEGEVVCQLLLRGEKSQMKSELEDENPHLHQEETTLPVHATGFFLVLFHGND